MIEQGIYRHFKAGDQYDVIGTGIMNTADVLPWLRPEISESEEIEVVVYRALSGRQLRVMSVASFIEHVERNGYSGPRFVKLVSNQTGPR